jgi:diguanylate cyclase (GGDEF)-like protein
LPETDSEEAARTAERIRFRIATTPVNTSDQFIATTISIGVATISGNESVDRLLQRADEALYDAKSRGRNLVRRHGVTSP